MSSAPAFTITNESVTVVWQSKTHTVQKTSPNFTALRLAILEERWDDIPNHLTVAKSLADWAKGKFTVQDGAFCYEGALLPDDLNSRMVAMATGGEDPTPLFRFWERLQKNPSYRSVQQLYAFLKHQGIPFTVDGCFLAYKGVRQDYKDVHSGKFDNSPGKVHEMPRNQISDDPKEACHEGFHVGALEYAKSFCGGGRVVVCKVAPEDVVCVPYDESQRKMRVCKYTVLGNWNGHYLPDTTFVDDVRDFGTDGEKVEVKSDECLVVAIGEPPEKREPKKGWAKFNKLEAADLLKESIEDLRQYAGKGLDIVGASKIPGGKAALVAKILEVRK